MQQLKNLQKLKKVSYIGPPPIKDIPRLENLPEIIVVEKEEEEQQTHLKMRGMAAAAEPRYNAAVHVQLGRCFF